MKTMKDFYIFILSVMKNKTSTRPNICTRLCTYYHMSNINKISVFYYYSYYQYQYVVTLINRQTDFIDDQHQIKSNNEIKIRSELQIFFIQ